MKKFRMCPLCAKEYGDITRRRYHAEPNACPDCGPEVQLKRNKSISFPPFPFKMEGLGEKDKGKGAIEKSIELLKAGRILAVKGIGGYHLACDARDSQAVRELRSRKYREDKPFALMAPTITAIRELCEVGVEEEKLLLSARRPIVLLKRKGNGAVAEAVAPGHRYLGVMLPYTPLHYLFFEGDDSRVLVMTSGNISDEPIAYRDEEALSRLEKIADYFLIHNRDIHMRCDDSVIRVWQGREMILRRGRGYVPYPLKISPPFRREILACGGELKNTFCLTRDDYAFLSHHIGDLENMETFTSFREGIEHFKKLFRIRPELIACDMHPEYLSTKYAEELSERSKTKLKLMRVQHHHAHVAACMAENGIEEKVIGVAFDGTGYGCDGAIWGGEFLLADFKDFRRRAHFRYVPMPGGEMAIKEPWRMAVSYLYRIYGDDFPETAFVKKMDKDKVRVLINMLRQSFNCPRTSSVGRLFDTVSSLLGIRDRVNYEGQAAVELEMIAGENEEVEDEVYEYEIKKGGNNTLLIDPCLIIIGVIDDLKKGCPVSLISAKFHRSLARIIGKICRLIRRESGVDKVVLSGGVFQNIFLLEAAFSLLREDKFQVYTHHKVPPNDGGLSLGQAVIAERRTGE
jgi:hydrogenase maturation protein HypF